MTVIAPVLAFAGFQRSRMVVNGVEVPFPKDGLNIAIELACKEVMGPIDISVRGHILEISNPNGDGIVVNVGSEAMVNIVGSGAGVMIRKEPGGSLSTPFGIHLIGNRSIWE